MLALMIIAPKVAGYVAGSLWILFILVPSLAGRSATHAGLRQDYQRAERFANFARWLHPTDGWRQQPDLFRALRMAQEGAFPEAVNLLARHQSNASPLGRVATAQRCRIQGHWEELVEWARTLPPATRSRDVSLMPLHLRALGETRDLDGLVEAYKQAEQSLEKLGNPMIRALCRLPVLAFCGRREHVERILNGELAHLHPNARTFWLGTTDMAAGEENRGRTLLANISSSSDALIRQSIELRLSGGVVLAEQALSEQSRQAVARVENELDHEARYETRRNFGSWRPYATHTLLALNLAAFAFEISLGDTTRADTLLRAGAAYPDAVLRGDWWRVFTACFLHFGLIHLLMNMLALYILGRFVEYSLGLVRYLATYLVAGVGSALTFVLLVWIGWLPTAIEAGASGCIMGLVGATGAILVRGWRTERAPIAFKRLKTIGLIVVSQAVFDLLTPQVSFTVHTSGVVIGFLTAFVLYRPKEYGLAGATTTPSQFPTPR
ncbi:MAG TPA: rhomboid family intramembrane serine protease [Verrucomicrobiae bacterium]|nr:rhomboid family intramembrane serine protease [Verrucomicrobiae bacterium]